MALHILSWLFKISKEKLAEDKANDLDYNFNS